MISRSAIILLALAGIGLAGCVGPLDGEPYNRPGTWSMNGSPLENTAAEVANKSDLLEGESDPYSSGVAAAAGVDLALGGTAGNATGLQKAPQAISFSSGTQ
jgi:hypothetical protein